MNFLRRVNYNDLINSSMLSMEGDLSVEDVERLKKIRRFWNFYDGFHWEEIPPQDAPEVTENYCRAYVNKFVAFEFGKSFNIKIHPKLEKTIINDDGMNLFDFLTSVWQQNSQDKFCVEMGQMKSITGDAWVQVKYFRPEDLDDPFGEYPKGRIRVLVVPTSIVFPTYDVHDKEKLIQLVIQYPIEVREQLPIIRKLSLRKIVYKQIWTKDRIQVFEGKDMIADIENPYGTIPFIQIKNFPVAGRTEGLSDLEDIVPLNVELNMKRSDVSEIIDYHSAPVTIVFGAKVNSLEKGANKLWGGLPKDAKVQNLELQGDLGASISYIQDLKRTMSVVGGVPEGSLGGEMSVSNTSGVALHILNMPLIERTRIKRMCSEEGLELVNKMIIHVALVEGLIKKPEDVTNAEFYWNEVDIPDTMPKDQLIELQMIETEMRLGLEDRKGAMRRLGKEDIERRIQEIDEDRRNNPELYGVDRQQKDIPSINAGMMNGETPIEQVRKEITGQNGGGEI